jgi:hypothetical protein
MGLHWRVDLPCRLHEGGAARAFFTLGVGAYLLLKNSASGFLGGERRHGGRCLEAGTSPSIGSRITYWLIHSRILTTTGLDLVRDHLDFIKRSLSKLFRQRF